MAVEIGVVKTGSHTEDNGTIFTISGSLYVEADVGLSLRSTQFGVFPGSTDMTQLNRWFSYCYVNRGFQCWHITAPTMSHRQSLVMQ